MSRKHRFAGWVVRQSVIVRFHARRLARKARLLRSPVRIVFLAQDPLDWWSMQSLYTACRDDRRFEAKVVSVGWGGWHDMSSDCKALFEHLRIDAIDGTGPTFALRDIRPEVVVISSPYDEFRPAEYGATRLLAVARLVYIPYGVDMAAAPGTDWAAHWYRQPATKYAWRIVIGSPARANQWVQLAGVPTRRLVRLGLPVLDQTHGSAGNAALPTAVREASADKFKVLYTPHHTLGQWCTFEEHAPTLRWLLAEHQRFFLAFRPHPGLGPTLRDSGVMSELDLSRYFGSERVFVDSSDDFFELLRWADVLVTDASSMLFHFAPTGKPIVYLPGKAPSLDPLTQGYIDKACYVARSEDELTATLLQLSGNTDPMAEQRRHANAQGGPLVMTDGAGQRISRYLAAQLT